MSVSVPSKRPKLATDDAGSQATIAKYRAVLAERADHLKRLAAAYGVFERLHTANTVPRASRVSRLLIASGFGEADGDDDDSMRAALLALLGKSDAFAVWFRAAFGEPRAESSVFGDVEEMLDGVWELFLVALENFTTTVAVRGAVEQLVALRTAVGSESESSAIDWVPPMAVLFAALGSDPLLKTTTPPTTRCQRPGHAAQTCTDQRE